MRIPSLSCFRKHCFFKPELLKMSRGCYMLLYLVKVPKFVAECAMLIAGAIIPFPIIIYVLGSIWLLAAILNGGWFGTVLCCCIICVCCLTKEPGDCESCLIMPFLMFFLEARSCNFYYKTLAMASLREFSAS